jgi:hypothetical protein
MPPVEFEPTISAGERPQTYALDRAAAGIGCRMCIQGQIIMCGLLGLLLLPLANLARTRCCVYSFELLMMSGETARNM